MEATNMVSTDTSSVFTLNYPYYPLIADGKSWSCRFQLKPNMSVVVDGEKPSEIDFVHAMQGVNAPVCLIQALYIAVCAAFNAK